VPSMSLALVAAVRVGTALAAERVTGVVVVGTGSVAVVWAVSSALQISVSNTSGKGLAVVRQLGRI
jgi:hypothetical protein